MSGSSRSWMMPNILGRGAILAGAMLAFAAVGAAGLAQERGAAQEGRVGAAVDAKAARMATLTPAERAQVQYGRDIAVAQCSSCHALDENRKSPNPDAPPLRNALWRFEQEGLATYFIEALQVGHGDMPLFDFTPVGTDALIAYLKSIKTPDDIDEK